MLTLTLGLIFEFYIHHKLNKTRWRCSLSLSLSPPLSLFLHPISYPPPPPLSKSSTIISYAYWTIFISMDLNKSLWDCQHRPRQLEGRRGGREEGERGDRRREERGEGSFKELGVGLEGIRKKGKVIPPSKEEGGVIMNVLLSHWSLPT